MTSTSFNPIQMQQTNIQTNQPLTLKEGQVFYGTIKQLYPEQIAEVQIGNHKFVAKLEKPLKAGDSYFLQVTSASPQAELKVVSGPMTQSITITQQMNQLLETMNLPKTNDMKLLLTYFIKEQIPISKEQMIQAELWMKNLPEDIPKQEALATIQKMVELKVPFTNDMFKALLYGSKTNGISSAIDTFTQLLSKETGISQQVKTNLLQQLQFISKPFEVETGGILLSKAIQTLTNSTESITNQLQVLNLLKEASILPKEATIQNWISQSFQQVSTAQSNNLPQLLNAGQMIHMIVTANPESNPQIIEQVKTWISTQHLLTKEQQNSLLQLVSRFETIEQSQQAINSFAKVFHEQLLKVFSENTVNQLFTNEQSGLSTKEQILSLIKADIHTNAQIDLLNIVKMSQESTQSVIQNLLTQAENQVQHSIDSKAMEQALKTVLKGLGISYEAALINHAGDVQEAAQTLKPQLLTLLQDTQTSAPLREAADQLIARLNGMQLLSGENGHQHQIIMQVPLQFFGKRMDATLQWNGRMQKDGKIDANYVRILFYLDMEALKETVIDMQVQNRIVTIHLYNEYKELEILAEPLKQSLKVGLAENEYQLSGIFIKQFANKTTENPKENLEKTKEKTMQHNGVDIRV